MFLPEKANGRRTQTSCLHFSFLLPFFNAVGNDASGVRGSLNNCIKEWWRGVLDIMTIRDKIGI
jgi:hypothetical protein